MTNDQLKVMQMEIDDLLTHQKQKTLGDRQDPGNLYVDKQTRYDAMQQ